MTQELNHTRTGHILRNAQSGFPSGLYRILIPAGTHLWRTGVQTYLSDSDKCWFCSDALAALKLKEPWRFGPNGLAALLPRLFC